MERLVRALDRADGLLQACRLLWPGYRGRVLRLCALFTALLVLAGFA